MKTTLISLLYLFGLFSTSSHAALVKTDVEYKIGKDTFQGYFVYDDAIQGNRPGVLVVHNWMGVSDEAKSKADQVAGLGYAAFVADIFGKDNRPADAKAASELAGQYRNGDRKKFREHLKAGFREIKRQKIVNASKVAAIGYCFGGTGVIELARTGERLKGFVSFHGGLDSPNPKDGKNIKAPVLALHGADDPYVSAENLAAFENEMRTHKVDWRLVKYGNAVHSFTEKGAGNDNSKGAAYNALADARSWEELKGFLAEVFK